jgi:putative DNA primase/helicase
VADPEPPKGLHDRAADNWRPLLAIADAAGGVWPETARRTSLRFSIPGAVGDSSVRVELLADLREIFQQSGKERLFTGALLHDLHAREDRRWGEWRRGQPLSAISLSRLLKPFGIRPAKLREGGRVRQGYHLERFEDAFRRYLPPSEPEHPEQINNDGRLRDSPSRNNGTSVPAWKSPETPIRTGDVPGVPAQNGGTGE